MPKRTVMMRSLRARGLHFSEGEGTYRASPVCDRRFTRDLQFAITSTTRLINVL